LRSGFGWHLVFLTGREPAGIARYEDVWETVRRDAIDAQREARNRDAYERLRRHFNIVRDQ
jgi:parvulin-like peptidyl-prolyl isomerase